MESRREELILTMCGHLNARQQGGYLSLQINEEITALASGNTQPTSPSSYQEGKGRSLTCIFAEIGDVLLLLFLAFLWIPVFLYRKNKLKKIFTCFVTSLKCFSFPERFLYRTDALTLLLSVSV